MKTNIKSIEELHEYLNANMTTYFIATYQNGKIVFENDVFEITVAEA